MVGFGRAALFAVLVAAQLIGHASAQGATNESATDPSQLGDYPHHREMWAQILHQKEPKDPLRYDKSDPPMWGKVAVQVNVSIYYNNLLNVKEKEGSYSMDIFFRLLWTDPRLKYTPSDFSGLTQIVLSSVDEARNLLWRPDTSFTNVMSLTANALLGELTMVRHGGEVYWSRHMSARLSATFDFKMFPYDFQFLPLEIECFKFSERHMKLNWLPKGGVAVGSQYKHSQYDVKMASTRRIVNTYPQVGLSYSALRVGVLLYRNVTNFFSKLILPVFLIVMISSLSYWIDPGVAPARVGLSVTCVLTQVAFSSAVSNILPRIAYMTWIDWYIMMAFIFNCFALLEYGVVSYFLEATDKDAEVKPYEVLDQTCRWLVPLLFTSVAVIMIMAGVLNPEPKFL